MTLWVVCQHYYGNSNTAVFEVLPYNLKGHLKCCFKWYGLAGLKRCYLSKRLAERKAKRLNDRARILGARLA